MSSDDLSSLQRELLRFRKLVDTAPDAIVVIDSQSLIEVVNAQCEALFGYHRSELLGEPLELLLPSRFHARHRLHLTRYFESPTVRAMGSGLQLFGVHRNGAEIPIEVSLSPMYDDGRVSVSAAIRDVTERRRIEAEVQRSADSLRVLAEELREARRAAEAGSAAKSEFLASMSHELRTPLNAVLGFAQLLQRDKKEPLSDRHLTRVNQIAKGGEHLLHLIDDILDLSSIESGRVSVSTEAVDPAEVLREVTEALTPSALAARVVVEFPEAPPAASDSSVVPAAIRVPMIAADRTRYAQILMNFGSNAIKYNRPGGTVSFEIATFASVLRVTVIDTGTGIQNARQGDIFRPFERAGQETGPIEGTGIGLAISKRLAELMGGRVGFRSTFMRGSAFWVEMPLHQAARSSTPPSALPEESKRLRNEGRGIVLCIEDNAANVEFIEDLVRSFEGVEFIATPTAEMGIEIARARRPKAILMDIHLPGMNGIDALGVLRRLPETRSIPVIALTAAASDDDRARGLKAGFFRYLTKPVQVQDLESALEALLTGEAPGT